MELLFSWSLILLLTFFFAFNIDSSTNGVQAFHKIYKEYQSVTIEDQNVKNRTGFHFQPKKNWVNDPNGPMYYKGMYHFFYQYNPKGAVWGNIVWAHSVSKDLINWEALKPAIYPSKPFDQYGCWSGSVTILPGDKPIIIYTGLMSKDPSPPGTQVQNYAIPADYNDPYLKEWIKPDDNPLIAPVHGETVTAFRDPTTAWFERGHWNIIVGSKKNHRGIAHLYRSKDFKKWIHAKHPLHSKEGTGMWECPDFYPVSVSSTDGLDTSMVGDGVKHVLKASLEMTRFDFYTIGTYDTIKDVYVPDNTSVDGWLGLRYDYGNFYASKTFYDPAKQRRVLWGWANESDTTDEDIAKGWAGIQLIPRKIWLDSNGKQLLQWPVEELDSLRDTKVELSNITLNLGDRTEIRGITAAQADVDVTFSFSSLENAEPFDLRWENRYAEDVCNIMGSTIEGGVGPFGLLTMASENLEEFTPIFFRVFGAADKYKVLLCSDAKSSSLNNELYKPSFGGYVDVDLADNKLSLRTLIDNSVLESFGAGGKTCISSRVYPTLAVLDDAHLHVFNNGHETITVERLEAWSMKKPEMN